MISQELKQRFEKIIEIKNIDWTMVDNVVKKDANILRPIKGIAFEEYLKKIIKNYDKTISIRAGVGDSDVDLFVNNIAIQAKTPITKISKHGVKIGVALHKTHGDERAPFNLYSSDNPTFDILCVMHPQSGVLIIPFNEIPKHTKWTKRLADPAFFSWTSEWINRWELLNINVPQGTTLENRIIPSKSQLPFLSSQTYLEDYEIIEMLCKPEYFRAAVMGLKGNIKEAMFIDYLRKNGYTIDNNIPTYTPYDLLVKKENKEIRIQVKGTSKNMCSSINNLIGTEIMGTHGQFPQRGYKRSSFDYLAIIISKEQLPKHRSVKDLNFIIIPTSDLPLHYLIGNGDENKTKGFGNKRWNESEFKDILYSNLKFKYFIENDEIIFKPHIKGYKQYRGYEIIATESEFRKNKKYKLNHIPNEW